MAKRSGEFVREGRLWRLVMADPEAIWEIERGVSLVCLRKEGAPGRGATIAG